MTTRARDLLERSRGLLNRSRAVAAEFLAQPQQGEQHGRHETGVATLERVRTPDGDNETALSGICSSLAMRDLNLVDALLAQLEDMETDEQDHERLGQLYRLDHLATRLRRNAENLRVLSGRETGEAGSNATSLVDVIRAAMSSIEGYARVSIGRTVALGVVGFAADDISRLLAELLDNATSQSAPDTSVRVSAHLTESGSVLVRIEDDGIGLPQQRLDELNERLRAEPVLDDIAVRHMGLAVVRSIAARHELRTSLERRAPHGTTAAVVLPPRLVCELDEDGWSGMHTVVLPRTGITQPAQETTHQDHTPATTQPTGAPGASGRPSPQPRPASAEANTAGSTTQSGLPRRVSRSIRNSDAGPQEAPQDALAAADTAVGHAQLLADLDAFSDGEQQAKDGGGGSVNGSIDPSGEPPAGGTEGTQR